jgi:hypothetical protein
MLSANGCTTIVGIVRAITSCGNAVVVVMDIFAGATVVDVEVVDVAVVDVVIGRVVAAFVVVGAIVVVVDVVVVVVVAGVIDVEANAATPVLTALRALTRNEYEVSFTRPVTVALSDADTSSLNTVHTPELCTEYSTT